MRIRYLKYRKNGTSYNTRYLVPLKNNLFSLTLMGIKVEFNPDLALRNISEHKQGRRKIEECIPEDLRAGQTYDFLKRDQRNYWLYGPIPLIETQGNEVLSRPKASIVILEATHFVDNDIIYTKGAYKVIEVFMDGAVHFEGFDLVGTKK
ncbi:hypothetical protein CO115_01870 [Candidatus Falkowbacteria bacterium CG_4_9_14_3_um_filter_36_9]|uniref:Uncharacterized protein n=1 Tax=Candidatus Falkowbacteria bacterium CG02_land_8_20_14_3_00_36_14 TaxID=1974560 RepID=A0A2M7DNM9_9BACT|nr:MAG: hypothetical protein COS18_02815 [Candidatus Falkowbacteria bacterium CG02_land_8_20_14_3_00_36_14]PIX10800.1 MAG: hypothetical protein COZ73_04700 [Candidatus Falkowbacteria bacterium CG_4_8_14_3_um_filter_36_11]PJA10964.1 MAG: hypothetical protein COX67_02270 [Candidatus Falkowbacteria bacterium CG_4_10_14_0_2_um_filter_36_22]PJB20052.1 MAG: hypothetical protein CO115_01870 [Candidatus Falkowbacteria bacterium CG_4_9_14_3_um_filter_36_9]